LQHGLALLQFKTLLARQAKHFSPKQVSPAQQSLLE
jgi:hypothetical protein